MDSELLRLNMEQFGPVLECTVEEFRKGRSKGYGIVQFQHESDAERAVADFNNVEMLGRVLSVQFVDEEKEKLLSENKHASHPVGLRVFVRNLPSHATSQDLWDLFKSCGSVSVLSQLLYNYVLN